MAKELDIALDNNIAGFNSKINKAGIDMILEFEGFRPEPYLCSAKVPTIGYGTTRYPDGKKVTLSDEPCTKVIAKFWFDVDLDGRELKINTFLKKIDLRLNENEFSALVSFAYNLGIGRVIKSGSVCSALKKHKRMTAANSLLKYNKARVGFFKRLTVLRGLTRRRKAERALFLKPVS